MTSLQREDGAFAGDEWGEIDSRFAYCGLCTLALLGRLRGEKAPKGLNVDAAAAWIASCANIDGGFGCVPGAESHAGQIWTCVAALAIAGKLQSVNLDDLGWWLCERQVDSGGLNGRPEKQADVCYSWWVLSSLKIIRRSHWINGDKLAAFIVSCQDDRDGGIADRPGNMADVYHTVFGLCGLSHLGWLEDTGRKHKVIDPVFALSTDIVARMGL